MVRRIEGLWRCLWCGWLNLEDAACTRCGEYRLRKIAEAKEPTGAGEE